MLADQLQVSQPTCLRRIRELLEAGVISANVAMVDPFGLGYGMLAFLEISLINQSDEHMAQFETCMQRESEVMQCYFVSGEYDYFIAVHVNDMDGALSVRAARYFRIGQRASFPFPLSDEARQVHYPDRVRRNGGRATSARIEITDLQTALTPFVWCSVVPASSGGPCR